MPKITLIRVTEDIVVESVKRNLACYRALGHRFISCGADLYAELEYDEGDLSDPQAEPVIFYVQQDALTIYGRQNKACVCVFWRDHEWRVIDGDAIAACAGLSASGLSTLSRNLDMMSKNEENRSGHAQQRTDQRNS